MLADNPIRFFADPVLGIIVLGEDHTLRRFDHSGKQLSETVLFQRPCTLAVLKNQDGSRKIAICYYYHVQFLSSELKPLNQPKLFGAMWTETAAAVDFNRDGNDDLVMHDIYGRGYHVDGISGAVSKLIPMVPGITDGILVVSSDPLRYILPGQDRLRCIKADGSLLWEHNDGSQYAGSVFWNGAIYSARRIGHVVALKPDTGEIAGVLSPGGRIFSVGVAENELWIATDRGLLGYAPSMRMTNFYPGCITHLAVSPNSIWAVVDGHLLRMEKTK